MHHGANAIEQAAKHAGIAGGAAVEHAAMHKPYVIGPASAPARLARASRATALVAMASALFTILLLDGILL